VNMIQTMNMINAGAVISPYKGLFINAPSGSIMFRKRLKSGEKRRREETSEEYIESQTKRLKKFHLRKIVIDGCNVAFKFGRDVFKFEGVLKAVFHFQKLGHSEVYVIVPGDEKLRIQKQVGVEFEKALEMAGILVYCQRRVIDEKVVTSHDDRLIIKYACETDAIIISNDKYRDWAAMDPVYKKTIKNKRLPYTFIDEKFIILEISLNNRLGLPLDEFLRC